MRTIELNQLKSELQTKETKEIAQTLIFGTTKLPFTSILVSPEQLEGIKEGQEVRVNFGHLKTKGGQWLKFLRKSKVYQNVLVFLAENGEEYHFEGDYLIYRSNDCRDIKELVHFCVAVNN